MAMNDILQKKIKTRSEKITVSFEKKINVKQYETETLSAEASIDLDNTLEGISRVYVESLLHCQLEYSVYVQAATMGYVTQTELTNKIRELECIISSIEKKAQSIGVDLSKYIEKGVEIDEKQSS